MRVEWACKIVVAILINTITTNPFLANIAPIVVGLARSVGRFMVACVAFAVVK